MASFDARAEPKMQMRSLIGPALFKAPPTRQGSGGTAAAVKASEPVRLCGGEESRASLSGG